MRIQIGTRVKFLNDVGGGIVRGFKDDKFALIETDDGFEMPVLLNELLIDSAGSSASEDAGDPKVAKEKNAEKESGVIEAGYEEKKYAAFKGDAFLAIVPQNDQLLHVSNFELYLINDSTYSLSYCISYKDSGVSTHIDSGTIEPDTKIELGEYSQSAISKLKEIKLQGIYYKYGLFDAIAPLNRISDIRDISFYKANHFSSNEYFHQKALLLKEVRDQGMAEALEELEKSDIGKIIRTKEEVTPKSQHKSPKNNVLEEVDLHIEAIMEDSSGLTNGEIVDAQMARFETALETAVRAKTQKIVFIHGVGNGKLKHDLRKKLDNKYPDLRYQDASFKEYGFGATLVYLK